MMMPLDAHQFPLAAGRTLSYLRTRDSLLATANAEVVFLHGVLRAGNFFGPLVAHLERYALCLLDQRGHGDSSAAERYLVVDYVADAVTWLRACVDRPVVLYGHSLGAMVAVGVAVQCPELVRGVVLEDPPFQSMGARIDSTGWLHYFRQIAALIAEPRSTRELAQGLADVRLTNPAMGQAVRLGDVRDAAALRFFAASLRRVDRAVLTSVVAGCWLDGYDERHLFSGLRCPVMVLQADVAAGGMLIDDDVRLLGELAADVLPVRFSDVGHAISWARTQEVANLVHSFMESLAS